MGDSARIDELRRRVESDPASIAFAQLAEEHRRAGDLERAVEVCRAGLARRPAYASARVTLGRALIDLDQLDQAESEMRCVLAGSPENLAAIRGLAEIDRRRGVGSPSEEPPVVTRALAVRVDAGVVEWGREPQTESVAGARHRRVIAALEAWLSAIHVARANPHA